MRKVRQPRTPGQRAGLTRARVLAAARELLAERGLDAVTMRAVAARLGVTPNSLYSHVANKTALIDEMLDELLAEVRAPNPETADPAAGLRALMVSTYEVLLAHPHLVPLYVARRGARGAEAQQLGDVMLTLLGRAGIRGAEAREAVRVLIVYTIGFAAFAIHPPLESGPVVGPSSDELAANFARGLRWLLAGIGVAD
jgi:TetR/AcrR family tetracycline transcriptional repressor